ncbi:hypothetical protein AA15669_1700 [Saccharibacter floricola DSM 15669]|uniref:Uncharacterized protein n=1 Tax=Saccharibacter floricola DSM 15669 TaxID=1123227 RepID=A0ABQ0P102_9PROT|nr:hypothetical protein AA15669_1700 [Saccharibacter floricola DSM 15669]
MLAAFAAKHHAWAAITYRNYGHDAYAPFAEDERPLEPSAWTMGRSNASRYGKADPCFPDVASASINGSSAAKTAFLA